MTWKVCESVVSWSRWLTLSPILNDTLFPRWWICSLHCLVARYFPRLIWVKCVSKSPLRKSHNSKLWIIHRRVCSAQGRQVLWSRRTSICWRASFPVGKDRPSCPESKCQFMKLSATLLSRRADADGLHLPEKVGAIVKAPTPLSLRELKSFYLFTPSSSLWSKFPFDSDFWCLRCWHWSRACA